ncbi:MAG: hypothetical protein OER43_15765 [Gammaproteobacteria bacterium]|nr:hypothetical protein [Gammaproteobacteria bacterium]MDH3413066.1 hypothetical protein [Gammaproteobacteria bacterium]
MLGKIVNQAYNSFEEYRDCIRDGRLHGYREKANMEEFTNEAIV